MRRFFNNINVSPPRTELVYCEVSSAFSVDLTTLVDPIFIRDAGDEEYNWRDKGRADRPRDILVASDQISYTPPASILTADVPGDEVFVYTYEATSIAHRRGGFGGCESEPSPAYIAVVGTPEVKISEVTEDGQPANNSVCIGRVDGVNDNLSYAEIELTVTVQEARVINEGGTSSFGGNGITEMQGEPRPISATYNPFLAVKLSNPDLPITSLNDDNTRDIIFSEDISYEFNNNYGGASCAGGDVYNLMVNGLPSVGFISPEVESTDTEAGEVCVNDAPFDITSTNATNVDPRFYVDGRQDGQRTLTLNPREVRLGVVSGANHLYEGTTLHRLTYLASNAAGCRNFVSQELKIYSIPDLDITPDEGCASEETSFIVRIANEALLTEGLDAYVWE